MSKVPVTARNSIVWPPLSSEGGGFDFRITLSIPTTIERETLGSTLLEHGCAGVTQDMIRAAMVDACFAIFDPDEAEVHRVELETFWGLDDEFVNFAQRIAADLSEDLKSGGKHRSTEESLRAEMERLRPAPRVEARYKVLTDQLARKHKPLHELMVASSRYDKLSAYIMVALHVLAIDDPDVTLERVNGRLTDSSMDALVGRIGGAAYEQLKAFVDDLYALPADTEKNSGSPPSNESGQTSSPPATAGNSTVSDTQAIPAGASPKTSEPSSASSTGAKKTKTAA